MKKRYQMTVFIEDDIQQVLQGMARTGADVAEIPGASGMVLVKAGSAEAEKRKQPGNRVCLYHLNGQTYYLCNA